MHVAVINRQRTLAIDKTRVAALVNEVVALENFPGDEVAIHFIGAHSMKRLHATYFDDPSLTDCISFPAEPLPGYYALGDVFICPQVALTYARQRGEDPYLEATLYIVHGLLHLIGYDDIKEKDRAQMRAAEKRHLLHLQKKQLLLEII